MLRTPRAPALLLALASLLLSVGPAAAQDHLERELPPGHPGRYAWEAGGEVAGGAGSSSHHYGHVFLSVGAGATFRTLIYVDSLHHDANGLAPPYLQLRGVYYFEGDGDFQSGVGLGISTNLTGEGLLGVVNERVCTASGGTDAAACADAGLDALAAWTLVPGYHARVWFGDWFQLLGRVGFGVTAASLPNVGFELGLGGVLKFLAGVGLYAEASFSTYFAADPHPLISVEGGLVVDYELLP